MNPQIILYYNYMDAILRYFVANPDHIPCDPELLAKKAGLTIEKPIAYLLCAKMSRDGFLQRHKNLRYSMYAETLFFIEEGGYTGRYNSELLKEQAIRADLALRKMNDRRLVNGTILVAVGAIGLVIWEMIKTFCLEKHP